MVVLLLCGAWTAHAKCALQPYEVSGHVSARDGTPVSGASVTVTWNDGTKSARSGRDGSFSVSFSFDPFSGSSASGDACEARLANATIEASAPGHARKRQRAAFVDHKAKAEVVLD